MRKHTFFVQATGSTNNLLRQMSLQQALPEGFLVHTDFQNAGKGQMGNTWESENGKNLLFSILLFPKNIKINRQFILSQLTCLAIKKVLDGYIDDISIKWSNDIYWQNRKMGGILIENSLVREKIEKCIIGVGLNVNQEFFRSDAPNPVSIRQITGKEMDREKILFDIRKELMTLYADLNYETIQTLYSQSLYRKEGLYYFQDVATKEVFLARIVRVEADGRLILLTDSNVAKGYYFKEVLFIH